MPERAVAAISHGKTHGPITALIRPSSELGEALKPFVFLDLARLQPRSGGEMQWHPHSGIATVTVIMEGTIAYQETTGTRGSIGPGGVEWMAAGGGVWHTGAAIGTDCVLGFQLWVALPPHREEAMPYSTYLNAQEVAQKDNVRVILGEYKDLKSVINSPDGIVYLDVTLQAGEEWTYRPRAGETVAWLCVAKGELSEPQVKNGEIIVFEEAEKAIRVKTDSGARILFGASLKHGFQLHLGNHSVHTSEAALRKGQRRIVELGKNLPPQPTFVEED